MKNKLLVYQLRYLKIYSCPKNEQEFFCAEIYQSSSLARTSSLYDLLMGISCFPIPMVSLVNDSILLLDTMKER